MVRKRLKRDILLIDLPDDILEQILLLVPRLDVIVLSTLDNQLRARLAKFVFREVKCTWNELSERKFSYPVHLIRSIRITDANSFDEYLKDKLLALLRKTSWPCLRSLSVNTMSLLYWLRYNTCTNLRELKLYLDASKSVKIFQVSHVENFQGLECLELHKYHFNWDDDDPNLVKIRHLKLFDCTWEYPFTLSAFNRHHSLHTLGVTYTRDNPFTLLERFVTFLQAPMQGYSESLRKLHISLLNMSVKGRLLTPGILQTMWATFVNLDELEFTGWTVNFYHLQSVLERQYFKQGFRLTLTVDSQSFEAAQIQTGSHNRNLQVRVKNLGDRSI